MSNSLSRYNIPLLKPPPTPWPLTRQFKTWTEEEKAFLLICWPFPVSCRAIAKRLFRTEQAIYNKANALRLGPKGRKTKTKGLPPNA